MILKGLKWGDFVIFNMAFLALIFSFIYFSSIFGGSTKGKDLMIKISSHEKEWIYPLDSLQDLKINGPLGITEIHSENGEVWVVASPCKNKICIGAGKIHKNKSWLACLPNKIFIQILSDNDKEEIDELSF